MVQNRPKFKDRCPEASIREGLEKLTLRTEEVGSPNRNLVVQNGTNEDEAKVFRTHAIPLGLCENLINALKLLANQQKDGDISIQNIITGLEEKMPGTYHEWAEKLYHVGQLQCSGGGSRA